MRAANESYALKMNIIVILAFENPSVHERQLLRATRVSWVYESNETMSLSQIIKIIGTYISLCHSSALSRIEFIFGIKVLCENTVKPRKEEPRKLRTNRLFLKILYPLVKNQCQGVFE